MTANKGPVIWIVALLLCMGSFLGMGMQAEAGSNKAYMDLVNGGVAVVLDPSARNISAALTATAQELEQEQGETEEVSTLVMANVKKAVNVRSEAAGNASKVGVLYKDCGGKILERQGGWTKIESGNLVGWVKDEYLLFGEEAQSLAASVGKTIAYIETDALGIRTAPSTDAEISGVLPKGEVTEVVSVGDDGWVCVDYEGKDGYVFSEFIRMDFRIDAGETNEEIQARVTEEAEAGRNVNYGEYTADADTTLLLAALIQCEAGGEPYEGQLAVGAVVMNRVRSSAYPDTIHGVIYASGQFTPAQSGKLNRVYESGKIYQTCIQAAQEALSGASNVGDLTHFRRNNGRSGLVIGNHVFY